MNFKIIQDLVVLSTMLTVAQPSWAGGPSNGGGGSDEAKVFRVDLFAKLLL